MERQRPHESAMRRICGNTETLEAATALYRTAHARTRPGSGSELGDGEIGLEAISAYLASEKLGNNDVDRMQAQQASCLKPAVFEKTLRIVSRVLHARQSPSKRSGPSRSPSKPQVAANTQRYHDLLAQNFQMHDGWALVDKMRAVEGLLYAKAPAGLPHDKLDQYAVFSWVCQKIMTNIPPPAHSAVKERLLMEPDISRVKFTKRMKDLNANCVALISAEDQLHHESAGPSTPAAPEKRALRSDTSAHRNSSISPEKRKVSFTPATNPKRRRVSEGTPRASASPLSRKSTVTSRMPIPTPSPQRIIKTYGAPRANRAAQPPAPLRVPSPEHVPMDIDSQSESEEGDDGGPKRWRPVFADRKQWARRDPQVGREWAAAFQRKDDVARLYGNPFGIS